MTAPRVVDQVLLERLLGEARESPRRRKNLNFHEPDAHPCQRLINAILPEAYIQPHRHLDPNKEEMLVILQGRLGLVLFHDDGTVAGKVMLAADGEQVAVNVPAKRFHTAVAFEPSVVFEAKAGPYVPHTPDEKAGFAPEEGSPEAMHYQAGLKRLFDKA
jgi:cupin fold WbuC family metalloprotein